MSYFNARCDTEGELHTIEGLLCVLDDAALTHLTQDETPMTSGIINLIQVIADRVKKAQELHIAELDAHRAEGAEVAGPETGRPKSVGGDNAYSAADLGLRRDEIHEARKLRDAERESPIASLHREIVRRHAFLNGDHGLSEEEFDAYNMETVALADQIVDIPARNADDMLRKIMGYTINGDHELSGIGVADHFFNEARALIG